MAWEQERHNAIARCAKTRVDCDEEEEIVLKLFRAQTRCEKRKWLAWREGRHDAWVEWYSTPPMDDFALVWTDKEKEEVLQMLAKKKKKKGEKRHRVERHEVEADDE